MYKDITLSIEKPINYELDTNYLIDYIVCIYTYYHLHKLIIHINYTSGVRFFDLDINIPKYGIFLL